MFALILLGGIILPSQAFAATDNLSNHPDAAYVSKIQISSRQTGTAPFDKTSGKGNDTTPDDNVVRSFDKIVYTVKSTFAVNTNKTDLTSFTGGTLHVRCVLPDGLKNDKARWDTDSLVGDAQNVTLSNNNLQLDFDYPLSSSNDTTSQTIPGNRGIPVPLSILTAANGDKIAPTFTTWLTGNTTDEYKSITDEPVTVSAAPNYNVELRRNMLTHRKVTMTVDGKERTGRVYSVGAVLELDNRKNTINKGVKGLEAPMGDIHYQLKLTVKKTVDGQTTDATDEVKPILWQYGINNSSGALRKKIADRNFIDQSDGAWYMVNGEYLYNDYFKRIWGDGYAASCYNSGDINASFGADTSTISAVKSGYTFNPNIKFPSHQKQSNTISNQVGCFSCDYYQFFVPTDMEAKSTNYYFSVQDINLEATSVSGEKITEQQNIYDDIVTIQHYISQPGSYQSYHIMSAHNVTGEQQNGQNYAAAGENVTYIYWFHTRDDRANDDDLTMSNMEALLKFDGEVVTPNSTPTASYGYANGDTKHFDGFKFYYLALKEDSKYRNDNGGYKHDDQESYMEAATYSDYDFYDSLEALQKDGKICTALYAESTGGTNGANTDVYWHVPMKIKSDAKIGTITEQVSEEWFWYSKDQENFDRTTQTRSKGYDLPKANYHEQDAQAYNKIAYDDSGQVKPGTHNGYNLGNSLLIVGGTTAIDINIKDTLGNGKMKTNYDLSKNEYTVHFSALPSIYTLDTSQKIAEDVKVIIKLPKGLTYHMGSSYIGGSFDNASGSVKNGIVKDPESTVSNSDGSTTITYLFKNTTTNEAMQRIHFAADIGAETKNGTSFSTQAIVECDDFDTRPVNNRSDIQELTVSVPTANRIFKTPDTPLVEVGDNLVYSLSYRNMENTKIEGGKILDILPYNADGRGTKFNGSYKLSTVTISNDKADFDLYYTTDTAVRTKNTSIGLSTDGWKKADKSGRKWTVDSNAAAFMLKGTINPYADFVIQMTLSPTGNKPLDLYSNSCFMSADNWDSEIKAVPVEERVVRRSIAGTIFKDTNQNGMRDDKEDTVSGITVHLKDKNGLPAKDVEGNTIKDTTTDKNGHYSFSGLPAGDYEVVSDVNFNDYDLTTKHAKDVPAEKDSDAEKENGKAVIKDINLPALDKLTNYDYVSDYHDTGLISYANLTVTKKVTGGMGDINRKFTFTFNVTDNPTGKTSFKMQKRQGAESTIKSGDTFTLSANQTATIKDILYGTKISVTEKGTPEYTPKAVYTDNGKQDTISADTGKDISIEKAITDNKDKSLTVTNSKQTLVPSGIADNIIPFIVIGITALLGLVMVKVRKQHEK